MTRDIAVRAYAIACRNLEAKHYHDKVGRIYVSGLVLQSALDRVAQTGDPLAGADVLQAAVDDWRRACDLQDYFIAP